MTLWDRIRAVTAPAGCAAGAALWNVQDLQRHWADSTTDPTAGAELWLDLRIAAGVVQALLLGLFLARQLTGRGGVKASAHRLRALAIYLPAGAVLAASLVRAGVDANPEAQLPRSVFFVVLLAGSGLLIAFPWTHRPRPSRLSAATELIVFNVVATLVLLELALGIWARVAPSPLLFGSTLEARLDAARPKPYSSWMGQPLNAGGYHDEEFFAAGDRDLVVAVLADSFGIGIVRYADNFVTIAETRLRSRIGSRYQRVALHNFGVPAIGLEEYAYLLESEALATRPTRVVLCVFVGNDVTGDRPFGAPGPARFALQDWLVVQLPRRLLASARAPEYVDALASHATAAHTELHEPVSFSPEDYLEIETARLAVTDPTSSKADRRYERFFNGLDYFRARLGDRLMLLVFPDEFQVNDELWQLALARQRHPEVHERDLPQRRIRAWAQAHGVPLVDTTAALRKAQQREPVYVPRNTHLGVRGNRIAGQLLADALAATLETRD